MVTTAFCKGGMCDAFIIETATMIMLIVIIFCFLEILGVMFDRNRTSGIF